MSDAYRTALLHWYAAFCLAQGQDAAFVNDTFLDFLDQIEGNEGPGCCVPSHAALRFFDARTRVVNRLIHGRCVAVAHR